VGKKRIIKKYEQLGQDVLKLIKQTYPDGFEDNLITFQTPTGELALALPLETEDISYLIKMPNNSLPEDDDDYDSGGSSDSDFGNFESLDVAEDVADDENE
jgi:hypothetical protein